MRFADIRPNNRPFLFRAKNSETEFSSNFHHSETEFSIPFKARKETRLLPTSVSSGPAEKSKSRIFLEMSAPLNLRPIVSLIPGVPMDPHQGSFRTDEQAESRAEPALAPDAFTTPVNRHGPPLQTRHDIAAGRAPSETSETSLPHQPEPEPTHGGMGAPLLTEDETVKGILDDCNWLGVQDVELVHVLLRPVTLTVEIPDCMKDHQDKEGYNSASIGRTDPVWLVLLFRQFLIAHATYGGVLPLTRPRNETEHKTVSPHLEIDLR